MQRRRRLEHSLSLSRRLRLEGARGGYTAALALAAIVSAAPAGAQPWRWETVAANSVINRGSAVAVTPDGTPGIAYYNPFNTLEPLKYDARPWGGAQSTSSGGLTDLLSVELRPDGTPLCSYVTTQGVPIKYYLRSMSGLVTGGGFCSTSPSFKIDQAGAVHLAYVDDDQCDGQGTLHYATNVSGDWVTTDLASVIAYITSYGMAWRVALDLGPGGAPRLVHLSGPSDEERLWYSELSITWSEEAVVLDEDMNHVALAVDNADQPHICYVRQDTNELRYATRSGGNWIYQTITDGDSYRFTSIEVDGEGTPHVVFWNDTTSSVRYARPSGSFWTQQTLGTMEGDPWQTSIAIDAYDDIHVSFVEHDANESVVRYASSLDCNDNNLHDLDEIDAGLLDDCNNNGHPDQCEIDLGFAEDCDGDGVPDECEVDCDNNGVPDDCGGFVDCNNNDVPDTCEEDCNGNGRPDDCDIDLGFFLDCNDNQVLDVCEPPFESDPKYLETTLATPVVDLRDSAHSWGDADEDGDLDLVVTGIANFGIGQIGRVYHRGPGGFSDVQAIGVHPMRGGLAEWDDFDNDGDLDFFLGGVSGVSHVFQVYEDTGITCTPTNGSCYLIFDAFPNVEDLTAAMWIDFDGDADRDVLFGSTSSGDPSRFFRNDGDEFVDVGLLGLAPGILSAVSGDYDADGDNDILVTGASGAGTASRVYRNDGGTFADAAAGLDDISGDGDWADYDADGDLDIILVGTVSGNPDRTAIYRNDGGTFVDIATAVRPLTGADVDWGDYDADGDLDVLFWGNESGGSNKFSGVFRNDAGVFEELDMDFLEIRDATISWADQDDDGDLDVLLSGETGTLQNPTAFSELYESECGEKNTPPGPPTNLALQIDGTSYTFSWDPGSDAETPSDGLTYNLRVGTAPGASDILSAMSDETTGYHRVPRMGNTTHTRSWTLDIPTPGPVFWGVQSIDGAFAGSAFATDATQPVCHVEPRSIDFGHVAGHADSSFTITNTGGGQLTGEITSTCGDFVLLSGGGPFSLGPLESLVVDVRFSPLSLGPHACAMDLGIAGCATRAYLGDYTGGLKIFDVADPTNPQLLSTLPVSTLEMQVVDGFVYQTGQGVFRIAGAFDPAQPYEVSATAVSSYTRDVRIVGTTAYVSTSASGQMHILDIETPTNPVLLGTFNSADAVWRLDVSGNYAYLASESEGLQVVEADDLVDPDRDGQYITPAPAWGVDVVGNVAFVASSDAGLQILDVTTPNPVFISSVAIPGRCEDVHVEGDYAYVAASDSGLAIVDVSDPATPSLVSRHQTAALALSVDVFAGFAFIAARSAGLEIVDVRDPANPVLVGSYDTDGDSRGIEVVGGVELAGVGDAVIAVPEVAAPELALRPGRPNPFAAATTIQLSLDRATDVTVTIYDVTGRRVRRLIDGHLGVGEHTATWDGRDEAGRNVTDGTYFLQLRDGSRVLTRKVVRVR